MICTFQWLQSQVSETHVPSQSRHMIINHDIVDHNVDITEIPEISVD